MKGNKHMKIITNIIYPLFALLTFACFALLQNAQAVVPPPDGGYANRNTAEGKDALFSLTTGTDNTAIGFNALQANTTGTDNTALGDVALLSNTTGFANTAIGSNALVFNNGDANTATGGGALFANTTGGANTAIGTVALGANTSGSENTATGAGALNANTTGFDNTATGLNTLSSNTTGIANTGDGQGALNANTTGSFNVATGLEALFNNTIGSDNVALGAGAGFNLTTGDNNIDIGSNVTGVAGEANTIRIGTQGTQRKAFIAGISATAVSGRAVMISSTGQLGVAPSSVRFKEEIKQMDEASESILALKPVTFRYKKEIDPDRTTQFGLVAEQVETINPDLVVRDADGKAFTVRYEAVNAMLLNEFLKEHRQVQEQQKEIGALRAELREQRTLIQKVSARIELQKAPAQTVANIR